MLTKKNIPSLLLATLINFSIPLLYFLIDPTYFTRSTDLYIIIAFITVLEILLVVILSLYNPDIILKHNHSDTPGPTETPNPYKMSFTNIKLMSKEIAVLYCHECSLYLPLKGFHCNDCGICFDNYRHHNFMFNNCITGNNLTLYFTYLILNVLNYFCISVSVYQMINFDNQELLLEMLIMSASSFAFTFSVYNILYELHAIGMNSSKLVDVYNYQNETKIYQRKYWGNIVNFMKKKQSKMVLARREIEIELRD